MCLFQITYLLQAKIFTSWPRWKTCIDTLIYLVTLSISCYSWVIKCNLTQGTLISEITNDRILKTLFKAKLLALVEQLVSLLKRKFPNAFFYKVISIQLLFRVSVRSRFWKYTAKFFYQILGKRLKSEEDNSVCFAGWLVYSAVLKKLNFSRKLSMFETCFSNVTL